MRKLIFLQGSKTKKKGFTLVELLVVISIIAILAVVGITLFTNVQKSARDARRRADLKAIATALEIYKSKNGSYPTTNIWIYSDSATQPWITGLDTSYMVSMPKDPLNTQVSGQSGPFYGGYTYAYIASGLFGAPEGSWFILSAHLENPNSADFKTQCRAPNGTTWRSIDGPSTDTLGPPRIASYTNTFWVCSQQ